MAWALAVLLAPCLLINTGWFCIETIRLFRAIGRVWPIVLAVLSILLSGAAIVCIVLYWSHFRSSNSPGSLHRRLYVLAGFPILLSAGRVAVAIAVVVRCIRAPECLLPLLIAVGGGL